VLEHIILTVILAIYALGMAGTILSVGKAKKPTSPGQAAVIVLVQAAIVAFLVTLW
jgi:hypothetical protein